MTYLFNDAEVVRKQIEALKAIYPEITEDADLLANTLEGETDLERVLAKLVDFVRDAEAMASAVRARKDEIAERQKRYERQSESGRKIIQNLMEAAQTSKVTLPEATLSIMAPREKVNLVDIAELPQGFYREERKALLKEILAALKAGQPVPGAEIGIGESSLTVRAK